jgi:integrase
MKRIDVVRDWINSVAHAHSRSEGTSWAYKHFLGNFCDFMEVTPQQILEEYDSMRDRDFRRKYAQYVRGYVSQLTEEGYANCTINSAITAVKSFFKYNDLPLGYVPIGRKIVKYHNRDIMKEEVKKILAVSRLRDKAFFCLMAQTGLRPETLCKLQLKHLQPDLVKDTIPMKIDVPQNIAKGKYRSYFTFAAEESVKYLKAYFTTRPNIDSNDLVFTAHGSAKPASRQSLSGIFRMTIERLKKKGLMDFEQEEEGKPRTIRLYSLRKFFRKYAHQAGFEFVQFWMGHVVQAGQEEHYRPRDVEFHRKLYTEKAMAFLRLEQPTPTETDKVIQKQAVKIEMLEHKLEEYDQRWERMDKILADVQEDTQKKIAILEDHIAKHRIALPKKLDDIIKETDSNLEKIAHNRKKINE